MHFPDLRFEPHSLLSPPQNGRYPDISESALLQSGRNKKTATVATATTYIGNHASNSAKSIDSNTVLSVFYGVFCISLDCTATTEKYSRSISLCKCAPQIHALGISSWKSVKMLFTGLSANPGNRWLERHRSWDMPGISTVRLQRCLLGYGYRIGSPIVRWTWTWISHQSKCIPSKYEITPCMPHNHTDGQTIERVRGRSFENLPNGTWLPVCVPVRFGGVERAPSTSAHALFFVKCPQL